MSSSKKQIRAAFRDAVFKRDGHKCRMCGDASKPLDAHHITDRNEMPAGGYVPENGISLCPECHEKAEEFHRTGVALLGFSPADLYLKIRSSKEQALRACARLDQRKTSTQ